MPMFHQTYASFFSKISFFIFLSLFSLQINAQSIKGFVTDVDTKEPLTGATVAVKGSTQKSLVRLDGSFVLKSLQPGSYEITVTNIGYAAVTQTVSVAAHTPVVLISLQKDTRSLGAVTMLSAGKTDDKSARGLEKRADVVKNILSQKTIELLPDVTVANAVQRMSGVTIQRTSSGEGRYAIIRGMDQRYNNTLVNGIKIPSPDNKYRYVPLDIFPSDLLERLEVIKSLTPAMEADATGGAMNLVMKSAPDKFLLNANIAGGYSTLFSDRDFSSFSTAAINKQSPAEINGNSYAANANNDFQKNSLLFSAKKKPVNTTLGLTVGDRFLNKRLGVLVGVSYQNIYRGSNSAFFLPNAQPTTAPGLDNIPVFSDIYKREYSTQTSRVGIHNKIDYIFNARNKISLYNLYLKTNEYQSRYSVDSVLAIQRTGPGSGNVQITNRSRWQQQSIYNATLQGDHMLSNLFKLNWSAVYSNAVFALPDMADYAVDHAVFTDPSTGAVTTTQYITQKMSRIWSHNTDQDLSGYLNMTYAPKIANKTTDISFGGLIRHKTRDNYDNRYTLDPVLTGGAPQAFTDIQSAQYFFKPDQGKGTVTATTFNNYNFKEDIASGYAQVKRAITAKLEVLAGVRVENTQQKYVTVMPANIDAKEGTINYTDILPSVNFKYAVNDKQNIRLSYFKSISRPSFFEIVPQQELDENFNVKGNPYIKHSRADNIDLRYELFPGAADQFLIGAFYKNIANPIELYVVSAGGPSNQQILPQNPKNNATNYGLEMVITKYFGSFGVSANYTYTKSKITTDKLYYYYDNGQKNKSVQQSRSLQGQANNIGNISLLYKNQKLGLDVQLAYVYTGERIALVSPIYNSDYKQAPYAQLDFSLEKKIVKHFSVYAKINNLTNAPAKLYIDQTNTFRSGKDILPDQDNDSKILVQKDIYKVTYLAGFRYKF